MTRKDVSWIKKDKILLVDDNAIIQKVGKHILFRKGFEVVLADHGEMALKRQI